MPESNGERAAGLGLRRDQQRALHAYRSVGSLNGAELRKSYRTLVHGFGATILRSGLAAAMSELERKGGGERPAQENSTADSRAVWALRAHLAEAQIRPLAGVSADDVASRIRSLPTDRYMLATRESLQVMVWLKRAVQAIITEKS